MAEKNPRTDTQPTGPRDVNTETLARLLGEVLQELNDQVKTRPALTGEAEAARASFARTADELAVLKAV